MPKNTDNINAFILAGGFSSRMGTNKALLEINGESLIQRTIQLLERVFNEVEISSNEPGLFNFTDKKIIKDIFPNKGPLSGIHSCLKNSDTEMNFIISTDMPFVSEELIRFLINYKSESGIIIPEAEGKVQQLCGLYSKKIIPVIEFILNESSKEKSKMKGSVFKLLNRVDSLRIDVTNELFYHNRLFFNLNTQNDLETIKTLLKKY